MSRLHAQSYADWVLLHVRALRSYVALSGATSFLTPKRRHSIHANTVRLRPMPHACQRSSCMWVRCIVSKELKHDFPALWIRDLRCMWPGEAIYRRRHRSQRGRSDFDFKCCLVRISSSACLGCLLMPQLIARVGDSHAARSMPTVKICPACLARLLMRLA